MRSATPIKIGSAVAVLGLVVGLGAAGGVLSSTKPAASTAYSATSTSVNIPLASLSGLIEQVTPAVVSVRVAGQVSEQSGARKGPSFRWFRQFGLPDGDSFRIPEEFGHLFPDWFKSPAASVPQGDYTPAYSDPSGKPSMGSGFFIDPEGHLVTSHHVVKGGNRIEVILESGKALKARVVGVDAASDLALLKVDADEPLPSVRLGSSSEIKVGDWVVAIGSPFGFGHTATVGIVSARGRSLNSGPFDDFIQLDAPINRGNSGGPAFNLRGEVIGVNTAIVSPTGVNAGVGFAVPSDTVQRVVRQLKETGEVSRGWLGVRVQTITSELATGLGLQTAEGALVASLQKGSPAEKAGVRQGDVITAVNGTAVRDPKVLARVVEIIAPGTDARLSVVRNGDTVDLTIAIGERPGQTAAVADRPRQEQGGTPANATG